MPESIRPALSHKLSRNQWHTFGRSQDRLAGKRVLAIPFRCAAVHT